MGPLPWWWLKIIMRWRRMRSVWIKERWFRSLPSTSRTCSWCTSLQTTTLQPLKDGSLAISWLPSLNPLQTIATEASSKCHVGFAGSNMWIFWEKKINPNGREFLLIFIYSAIGTSWVVNPQHRAAMVDSSGFAYFHFVGFGSYLGEK